MALVTVTKAVLEDVCTWQYIYNDASMRIETVRCINDATRASKATIYPDADPSVAMTLTAQPSQTTSWNVPQGQANKWGIGLDANGRITGCQQQFSFV